jgi:uncharacterized membrane protein
MCYKHDKNKTKEKKMNKTKTITYAGLIAALYVVLTFVSNVFGLASGPVQLRLSEALTILPVVTPSAIPGLFVGCLFANIFTGALPPDIIFGTLATLIGAIGTYLLRKNRFLAALPPVVSNAVIVPFVLIKAYGLEETWWYFAITVGAGELLSCVCLGLILLKFIQKYKKM